MTERTRRNYEETLQKARMALVPIQMGDCEPIDLFSNAAMWLLLFESFERLVAIVVDSTPGHRVEWLTTESSEQTG